jgi:hypothetical protein
VLATPDSLPGETAWGRPILEFRKYNDFGHFLTGEVRVYCAPGEPAYRPRPGSCHYRLRRAYVEAGAAGYSGPTPVSRWAIANFDAARLTRHFRETGIAPDTDWWMADRTKLFATMPSPVEVLMENVTVIRLDSRDCPGFARAIEALDRQTLTERTDLLAVGEDQAFEPPWPHAVTVEYTLRLNVGGANGRLTLTGSGGRLEALVDPVLDAADVCERAR